MGKTSMNAYTKLTVVMLGHLAAIFGDDQRRSMPVDKIRNLEEKQF